MTDVDARPGAPGPNAILRLLVISSDTYPPRRVDVSVLFGEELSRRGHRIDWILQSEQPCRKSGIATWGGGRVWIGPTDLGTSLLSRIRKHLRGIVHDLLVFPRVGTGDYDVVEVKDKFISGLFAVVAAWMYHRRFVYWLSYPFGDEYLARAKDADARHPWLYFIRGTVSNLLLYKILLPAADHVFVQSEQMLRDIAMAGIPPEKMTAVPMGIQAERFAGLSHGGERTLMPAHERCVLYLGTLNKVRRLDFLVRVLARVRATVPGTKLYFVGGGNDPGDEEVLIQEAKRLGVIDSIVLTGPLPQMQALRYVQEADVCVSPFFPTSVLLSTSPTKLVEYLAMGKAVVANDHPEQRLIIGQSHAGYCVPYEEAAFADAVVSLLNAPEAAALMGERGRRYVLEHRDYRKIADTVEATFQRLLEKHT